MNVKVSVIIPAYNAAQFLADTLQSVRSQSYDDYEIIVIDDGSTDDTRAVVESFPGIRYHYQSNRGPAAARNAGLRLAQGEYLAFLDADDLWRPEMLQSCISILEEHPEIGAVQVKWLPIDGSGKLIGNETSWQPWRGDVRERLLIDIPFNTSSIVWRRDYWEQIGGYDETPETNDDWINWMRIVYKGCQFECIAEPLVLRRRHADALTRQQTQRVIAWRFRALETLCQELELSYSLCCQAYASLHWLVTIAGLQSGDDLAAQRSFTLAVLKDPELLENRDTYFALIYQGKDRTNTLPDFTSQRSLQTLFLLLGPALNELASFAPGKVSQSNVWGLAFFCLAQACYAEHHGAAARKFAWQSCRQSPRLWLSKKTLIWGVRFLLGPRTVQHWKRS